MKTFARINSKIKSAELIKEDNCFYLDLVYECWKDGERKKLIHMPRILLPINEELNFETVRYNGFLTDQVRAQIDVGYGLTEMCKDEFGVLFYEDRRETNPLIAAIRAKCGIKDPVVEYGGDWL